MKVIRLKFYAILPAVWFVVASTVGAADKITIGAVEDVALMPWGVSVPALIDTGAPTTCLEVNDLRVQDNMVEFRLLERNGGLQLRLPLIGWLWSRATDEPCQRRPAVELELCLGSIQFRTQVTLSDHSYMEYSIIIGRGTLEKTNFLIDVSRSYTLSRTCLKEVLP